MERRVNRRPGMSGHASAEANVGNVSHGHGGLGSQGFHAASSASLRLQRQPHLTGESSGSLGMLARNTTMASFMALTEAPESPPQRRFSLSIPPEHAGRGPSKLDRGAAYSLAHLPRVTKQPVEQEDVEKYRTTGVLSRLTWSFLTPLFTLGASKPGGIQSEDLPRLDSTYSCRVNAADLKSELERRPWKPVASSGSETDLNISTRQDEQRATLRFISSVVAASGYRHLVLGAFAALTMVAGSVGTVIALQMIMQCLESSTCPSSNLEIVQLVGLLAITLLAVMFGQSEMWGHQQRFGIQVYSATSGEVFRRILNLRTSQCTVEATGEFANFMSNDTTALFFACIYVHQAWVSSVLILLGFLILAYTLGVLTAAAVIAFTVLVVPVIPLFHRLFQRARNRMLCLDQRSAVTTSLFEGIRVVKLYAWELVFMTSVKLARQNEMHQLRGMLRTRALIVALTRIFIGFVAACVFYAAWIMGIAVDVNTAILTLATLELMTTHLVELPDAVAALTSGLASAARIGAFLTVEMPAGLEYLESSTQTNQLPLSGIPTGAVLVHDAAFSFASRSHSLSKASGGTAEDDTSEDWSSELSDKRRRTASLVQPMQQALKLAKRSRRRVRPDDDDDDGDGDGDVVDGNDDAVDGDADAGDGEEEDDDDVNPDDGGNAREAIYSSPYAYSADSTPAVQLEPSSFQPSASPDVSPGLAAGGRRCGPSPRHAASWSVRMSPRGDIISVPSRHASVHSMVPATNVVAASPRSFAASIGPIQRNASARSLLSSTSSASPLHRAASWRRMNRAAAVAAGVDERDVPRSPPPQALVTLDIQIDAAADDDDVDDVVRVDFVIVTAAVRPTSPVAPNQLQTLDMMTRVQSQHSLASHASTVSLFSGFTNASTASLGATSHSSVRSLVVHTADLTQPPSMISLLSGVRRTSVVVPPPPRLRVHAATSPGTRRASHLSASPSHQDDDSELAVLTRRRESSGVRQVPMLNLPQRMSVDAATDDALEESPGRTQSTQHRSMMPLGFSSTAVSFECEPGSLTVIVGPVGSGKSVLLSALLGEVSKDSGVVRLSGRLAYASEVPWVLNSSIRNNITLGHDWGPARRTIYEIIRLVNLEEDIADMRHGLDTVVGARGETLSEGQKQRLILARILYHDPDIALYDDPISAVDAIVASYLIRGVFAGAMRGTTQIVISNHTMFLPLADNIILMEDGAITTQGSLAELHAAGYFRDVRNTPATPLTVQPASRRPSAVSTSLASSTTSRRSSEASTARRVLSVKRLAGIMSNELLPQPAATSTVSAPTLASAEAGTAGATTTTLRGGTASASAAAVATTTSTPAAASTVATGSNSGDSDAVRQQGSQTTVVSAGEAEAMAVGAPPWSLYRRYLSMAGGMPIMLGVLLALTCEAVLSLVRTFLLADWVVHPRSEEESRQFWGMLAALLFTTMLAVIGRELLFVRGVISSVTRLHDLLLANVVAQPMAFFDANPTGRLLNRFTRDLTEADEELPLRILTILLMTSFAVTHVVAIAFIAPVMILMLVPSLFAFIRVRRHFLRTARMIERIKSIRRSAIFSHLTEAMDGVSTIRAFQVASFVRNEMHLALDRYAMAVMLIEDSSLWLHLRVGGLAALTLLLNVTFLLTGITNVSLAYAGVAVMSSLSLILLLGDMVEFSSWVQVRMNSIQRITDWHDLSPEGPRVTDVAMAPGWPDRGHIQFDKVVLRYAGQPMPALRGVSFTLEPREKVGVVGRTGAGKSSLISALFRLVDIESGRIMIDGVDVSTLGLRQLRKGLVIMPQEQMIFNDTVRFNLDPHGVCSNKQLWDALDHVRLTPMLKARGHTLDSHVHDLPLSTGERSLLAIARVIVREPRILVIDEATSSMDPETEEVVSRLLTARFADCTILTIAHRLSTVLACDRIIVLEQGHVKENDRPSVLLSNPHSHLSQLCRAAQLDVSGVK